MATDMQKWMENRQNTLDNIQKLFITISTDIDVSSIYFKQLLDIQVAPSDIGVFQKVLVDIANCLSPLASHGN